MQYKAVDYKYRGEVTAFICSRWLTDKMIIRGAVVDMTRVDGIAVYDGAALVALITYTINGGVCEITSLDSTIEGRGIGTDLIKRVIDTAKSRQCDKVIVVTTNDNIGAIRFYQNRGFDMARLYLDALDVSRTLKPEIPLTGEDGIPLRHEIEFEYDTES